jgi:hypothetical protein
MVAQRVIILGVWVIPTTLVLKVEAEGPIPGGRIECLVLGRPEEEAKALLVVYRILEHHTCPDSAPGMQRG